MLQKVNYEDLAKVNEQFQSCFLEKFNELLAKGIFVLGNNVKQFEKEFADYLGVKNCVGVASGLDALELSFLCANLPKDSEIIVAANSYYACVLSILNAGLVPVLVEPDKSLNIDVTKIEELITPYTKGILAVHMYGNSCDMDSIQKICKKHNLLLFEDCAQSHGATFNNKKTGTFGDFAAFSFYPTKNLGALGDAGAVVCKSDDFANKIRMMRHYGFEKKYYVKYLGRNSRLDEIQAAFLLCKLPALDKLNSHKKSLANIYKQGLSNISQLIIPIQNINSDGVYHLFPVLCERRDDLKKFLEDNDVFSEIHYPVPPHLQEPLKKYFEQEFPFTEHISNSILSLPISFSHTEEDISVVINLIKNFYGVKG